MSIRKRTGVERACVRSGGNGQGRRVLATAGLALAIAAVAMIVVTGSPEPAHACLLPGIPC